MLAPIPTRSRRRPAPRTDRSSSGFFFIAVVSFDWNGSQYITPRHTEEELREELAPLKRRLAKLETALAQKA
jgi:hypothetical protein